MQWQQSGLTPLGVKTETPEAILYEIVASREAGVAAMPKWLLSRFQKRRETEEGRPSLIACMAVQRHRTVSKGFAIARPEGIQRRLVDATRIGVIRRLTALQR